MFRHAGEHHGDQAETEDLGREVQDDERIADRRDAPGPSPAAKYFSEMNWPCPGRDEHHPAHRLYLGDLRVEIAAGNPGEGQTLGLPQVMRTAATGRPQSRRKRPMPQRP
jgi:hypothetical protein